MHSKPQKRTADRLTYRESWKSCLPAKTKARARISPPFLQPSCALRSRFEAVLKGSEKPFYYDLHLCKTPIHKQFRSRDVTTVVGCEKHHGLGDLIGSTEPAKRNRGGNCRHTLLARFRGSQ